jgi:hypothetical protein
LPIRWFLTVVAFSLLASPRSFAAQGKNAQPSGPNASQNAELLIPAGTIVPLEIKNTINSRTAYVGEVLYCETIYPVTKGDHILLPAHSFAKGLVTDVVRPGKVKGKAQLSLRFDSLTLPDGTTRPIQATVYSIAGCRLDNSKASEESADEPEGSEVTVSGAQEAVIDATGLGGANPISAASQGVGGLALMLVTRGKVITLRPGTTMEIQLTAPADFSPGSARRLPDISKPPTLSHRPPGANSHKPEIGPQQTKEHH